MEQPLKRAIAVALLLLIGLLATTVRLWGADFGLPFLYDPDEREFVVRAFKVLASKDLNPHWFGHPGSLTIYSFAAAFGVYGFVNVLLGNFEDLRSIGRIFWHEPAQFYLVARWVVVACGAATVFLVYAATRQLADRKTALLAALLTSILPLHVQFSHIARTDIQQTALLVLVLYFSLALAAHGRWRHCVAAGFVLGLAIATKYPSVVGGIIILAAWVADQQRRPRPWGQRLSLLLATALACVVGTFLAAPFLFLDFKTVVQNLAVEGRVQHLSATSPGFFRAVAHYIGEPLMQNFSAFGLLAALAGMAALAVKDRARGAVLISFPVVYLLFISNLHLMWDRWVIPMLPFVAMLAAIGFVTAIGKLTPLLKSGARPWLAGILALAWLALPGSATLAGIVEYEGSDTRTIAFLWAREHLPPGSRILVERYTPQLEATRFNVFEIDANGLIAPADAVARYVNSDRAIGELLDATAIQNQGIAYVIVGSDYERRLADQKRFGKTLASYVYIISTFREIFSIEALPGKRSGGTVKIFATDISSSRN